MKSREEKLNAIIEKFFDGLGYGEIEVFQDDEFAYYYNTEEISYTLCDNAWSDLGFSAYIQKNYPDCPTISIFTLSLLHELGHHITKASLNKRKTREAKKQKKNIENTLCDDMEKAIHLQMVYCGLYDEKKATDKAVELLKKNYKWCLKFEYFFRKVLQETAAAAVSDEDHLVNIITKLATC